MRYWLLLGLMVIGGLSLAQTDSLLLPEVNVSAYLGSRSLVRLPASVAVLDSAEINRQSGQSFVPLLNTVAGVRMEERSPGSYRLSIRGSLLRSPFGIRNIKIYMEEFPLTDAGGNSYLNLLDVNCIRRLEVLKGPDGSLFGANSGGVLRLSVQSDTDANEIRGDLGTGSYGFFREGIALQRRVGRSVFSFAEGWQRSDGYRRNSALDRKYVQLGNRWLYSPKASLSVLAFYSHLDYETPGGLTELQWQEDPRAARPGTQTLPGAEEQNAGVRNSTGFAGISHEAQLGRYLRHVIALSGMYTDFHNPFITNYETREERTGSARTFLEASNNREGEALLKMSIGGEIQQTDSRIRNYQNDRGRKDSILAADQVNAKQGFFFAQMMLDLNNKLIAEAALSLNFSGYSFAGLEPARASGGRRAFSPRFMPRVALSYRFGTFLTWRASLSKGYSAPTIAEIRSSDNVINSELQPEEGWNYETGFRISAWKGRIRWDASVFYYSLEQAIVRRMNESDQEYFVNAGGTIQPGLESELRLQLLAPQAQGFFRQLDLLSSFSYAQFTFENYRMLENDYSGNRLTGVPERVIVSAVDARFPLRLSLYVQHSYTSSIPLNDDNSVYANAYQLLQLKLGWKALDKERFSLQLYAGADNLLDERYSLGNDLNAVGGRYFNPAPGRNWVGGLRVEWR